MRNSTYTRSGLKRRSFATTLWYWKASCSQSSIRLTTRELELEITTYKSGKSELFHVNMPRHFRTSPSRNKNEPRLLLSRRFLITKDLSLQSLADAHRYQPETSGSVRDKEISATLCRRSRQPFSPRETSLRLSMEGFRFDVECRSAIGSMLVRWELTYG